MSSIDVRRWARHRYCRYRKIESVLLFCIQGNISAYPCRILYLIARKIRLYHSRQGHSPIILAVVAIERFCATFWNALQKGVAIESCVKIGPLPYSILLPAPARFPFRALNNTGRFYRSPNPAGIRNKFHSRRFFSRIADWWVSIVASRYIRFGSGYWLLKSGFRIQDSRSKVPDVSHQLVRLGDMLSCIRHPI